MVHGLRRFLLLVLLLLAACPAMARADDALARRKFKEGQDHFAAQRYREAAIAYEAAYAAKNLPAFLFNVAQSYRNLGHLSKAVTFYKAYLADAPQAGNRKAVQQTIAELERQLKDEKGRVPDMPIPVMPPPVAPAPTAPTPLAAEPAPVATPPAAVLPSVDLRPTAAVDVSGGTPGPTPIYRRWWFWTIIGVAVAGGATAAGVLATRGGGSITQSTLGEFRIPPPAR